MATVGEWGVFANIMKIAWAFSDYGAHNESSLIVGRTGPGE